MKYPFSLRVVATLLYGMNIVLTVGCDSRTVPSQNPTNFKACDLFVEIGVRKLKLRLDSMDQRQAELSQYGLGETYLELLDVTARTATVRIKRGDQEETIEAGPVDTTIHEFGRPLRFSFVGGTKPPFENSARIGKVWRLARHDESQADTIHSQRIKGVVTLSEQERHQLLSFLSQDGQFGPPGDCDGDPEFLLEVLEAGGQTPLLCLIRFECGGRIDVVINGKHVSCGFSADEGDAANLREILYKSK